MPFSQQIQISTAERAAYNSTQIYYKLTTSLNTYNEMQICFDEILFWHDLAPHKVDYSFYGWSSIGFTQSSVTIQGEENCVCFYLYMFLFSVRISLDVRESTIISKSHKDK